MSLKIEEILCELTSKEPFFAERMKCAVDRAKSIVSADLSSEEAQIDRMKYIISRHFLIPFHDKYFEDLTLDDLLLEVMLISESGKDKVEAAAETIQENKDEAAEAFGDLIGDEEVEMLDVPEEFSQEEREVSQAFMKGGFAALGHGK